MAEAPDPAEYTPVAAATIRLPLPPEDLQASSAPSRCWRVVAAPLMAFALPEDIVAAAVFRPDGWERIMKRWRKLRAPFPPRCAKANAAQSRRWRRRWLESRQATGAVNAFTAVTRERALAQAATVDATRAAGRAIPGRSPACRSPSTNLYDVAGPPTIAGSHIDRSRAPAVRDAAPVRQLIAAAGAILVGALNMDEYAYGFSTENTHYGATRNPHAIHASRRRLLGRIGGGGRGFGWTPWTLGSDTNGSIRVPAALCGVFGLKLAYVAD